MKNLLQIPSGTPNFEHRDDPHVSGLQSFSQLPEVLHGLFDIEEIQHDSRAILQGRPSIPSVAASSPPEQYHWLERARTFSRKLRPSGGDAADTICS
jgi:hypothetical protein